MAKFFNSSIGKKLIMALMGLFLAAFLIVHLSINLLVLKNDGGLAYQQAVHFMTTNILVKIVEFFLFGSLILHIIYGIIVQIHNWLSRPVRYAKKNHSEDSVLSKYMIHTGIVILIFLIIHFMNFYFVKQGWVSIPPGAKDRHDFYHMVINLFKNPFYAWLYIVLMLILSFHLNHAIQSAFQTLGWNHPVYTPILKFLGTLYSIVVPFGFAFIPFYVLYFL
jgi:succinate dehydrogenase / fumarate reductase cytochrome b subunit